MLPKFKAALFDMDGTLLSTMRYWRLTTLELMLSLDVIPTPEQMTRIFSTSGRKISAEILASNGIEMSYREIVTRLEGYMHRHYLNDAKKKPRVEEYLETLRAAGVPMCVATGAPREFARDGLERLGLAHYFEFITDGYEFGIDKHSADYFRLMAQKLGVETAELCVFEDALYSIKSAKEAGCPVVAIWDKSQEQDWEEISRLSDHQIMGYADLL